MIRTTLCGLAALSFVSILSPSVLASDEIPEQLEVFRNAPADQQAEILVLGTFHFKDAGLDSYKPQHDIDIFSEERQVELEEVLQLLEEFAPTKIALEVDYSRRAALDSSYAAYLAGEKELTSNEIHQIGFRLAKRLGHEKVYAVDAPSEGLFSADIKTQEQWQKKLAEGEKHGLDSEIWHNRLMELYAHDDSAKVDRTLRETFLYMNSPERLITGHGHYVIGSFQVSNDDEYIGPNGSIGWWVRNLRIVHNLVRMTESTDDRILLLIGAGHAPIINHTLDASPQYRLVPVSEVLGG